MRDDDIIGRIGELIAEEHDLRERLGAGELSSDEENDRIKIIESRLDQCWDLLRQRRAHREFGEDPDHAAPRPVSEIDNYQQ